MKITEVENYIYNKEYDSFCFHNCVKQILAFYGIENANLYINMSLIFRIRIENNELLILDNNVGSVLPEFNNLVSRLNYSKDVIREQVWYENIKVIKTGEPIITGVDSYYLHYFPSYKKNHGRHNVIVDDYDDSTKMVSVLDWIEPWFFRGQVPLEEFLDARDSLNEFDGGIYSGRPILNHWAIVKRKNISVNTKELILSQLMLSYNQYYVKENIANEFNGIFATIQLKKYFETLLEYNKEESQEILKYLHRELYIINRRRDFFKLFLCEAGIILKNEELNNLANEMLKIYSMWEKFTFLVVKASLRIKSDSISKLIDLIDEIIKMEECYKQLLEDAIQKLRNN